MKDAHVGRNGTSDVTDSAKVVRDSTIQSAGERSEASESGLRSPARVAAKQERAKEGGRLRLAAICSDGGHDDAFLLEVQDRLVLRGRSRALPERSPRLSSAAI